MHAIKKAARRSAWYSDDNNSTFIPNPFGRMSNRPRRQPDEENALHQTVSENQISSPQEDARRRSYQESQRDNPGPLKAGTFPNGRPVHLPPPSPEQTWSSEASKESRETPLTDPAPDTAAQRQESGFVDGSVASRNGGTRNRKLRKFMPWKSKQDTPASNGDRADTSDSKKDRPRITFWSQVKVVLVSWINLLLVFVPAGIALGNTNVSGVVVFCINFVAIVPLAGMLAFATEELAMYIGETLGGLLNASFGNAVELIVGVIALKKGEILIVQTSLIGSMLSNLLLVLGMCFFFGGLRRTEQYFNVTVAQTGASLLALVIGSLIIPTAFARFGTGSSGIAPVSRATSVLLLFTYACYLIFQLRTHVDIYNEPSQKSPKKPSKTKKEGDAMRGIATIGAGTGAAAAGGELISREDLMRRQGDDDDGETPQLTRLGAFITLAVSTALVAICAEYMVDGIDAVAQDVSQEFIGLILLPIVGNAAEHATAVTVAIKDKMDLAIGVAVGSSLQIALLVLPLMVLLNWFGVGAGASTETMTLNFDGFLVSVLFISIILVNYLIQDGKSHWLEGALLQVTYLIIAVSAWYYPAKGDVA